MERTRWLFCDADDTLWENNIFFEQAIEEFVRFVDHSELAPAQVRERLDAVEVRNIKLHGYGTDNFARNLVECFEQLRSRQATTAERERLVGMTDCIRNCPIRLLEGVAETLAHLSGRYRLALVTKGQRDEQRSKLERSGLQDQFDFVCYAPEKSVECYREVLEATGADASTTWMIGNSPKSDINPALAAGLGAVLVPHANTWSLEVQPVPEGHDRFRVARRFSDLATMF